jgi:hypothetical protein
MIFLLVAALSRVQAFAIESAGRYFLVCAALLVQVMSVCEVDLRSPHFHMPPARERPTPE